MNSIDITKWFEFHPPPYHPLVTSLSDKNEDKLNKKTRLAALEDRAVKKRDRFVREKDRFVIERKTDLLKRETDLLERETYL